VLKKIRVGVLFGGRSAEHEISLLSAKTIVDAMDKEKYEIALIGINKSGEWFLHQDLQCLSHVGDAKKIQFNKAHENENVALVAREVGNPLVSLTGASLNCSLDVVFPVLHGTYGEDGTVQGLLKLANMPFVGAGVLASAVGMDKDVMKRLLRDANIPIAKFITLHAHSYKNISFDEIQKTVGLPFFVKPANAGSSIGISKVKNRSEFEEKIALALQFDRKILIEESIVGREIECAVLGNEKPVTSLPGEIIPSHEFHSYEEKYLGDGAIFKYPAVLSKNEVAAVQAMAVKTYQVLCCEGMGRVDMFLQPDGRVVVNEINTIPGFTATSMYPKMWEASGLSLSDLIDQLIALALERFKKEQNLKTTFSLESQECIL
jgi:D-alanine-D-alanine ligase